MHLQSFCMCVHMYTFKQGVGCDEDEDGECLMRVHAASPAGGTGMWSK